MYLSAERLALANSEVRKTFERTSIAWQAIPHWETGDPGATKVRGDAATAAQPPNPSVPGPFFTPALTLIPKDVQIDVTLAQASAPTPDALLATVTSHTVELARTVDDIVIPLLYSSAAPAFGITGSVTPQKILDQLIPARAKVEDAGYRASSCIVTNTLGLTGLSQFSSGYTELDSVLQLANVNSLHRSTTVDPTVPIVNGAETKVRLVLLGRRNLIAHGRAQDGAPGDEPVDIAVSVPPSLAVVGEAPNGNIELAVRISFVTRIKDAKGIASVAGP